MRDQNLQHYLSYYGKRMNKPLQVNVIKPMVPEEEEKRQEEQIEGENFNPEGWELFSNVLGHLNVSEGIVRNENRLGLVREYKTKGIPEGVPKPTTPLTCVQAAKKKKCRDVMSSPYKWLK